MTMKAFTITVDNQKITRVSDNRYDGGCDITNGKGTFGSVRYTRRDEDVIALEKQNGEPHPFHTAPLTVTAFDGTTATLCNEPLGVSGTITALDDALKIEWHYENELFSHFGGHFPLNLLGQLNGDWLQQFTVSSPYHQQETGWTVCLFTRADGNHLMLIAETPCAAFRVDYSTCLHFIDGFELVENRDRCYGDTPKDSGELTAYLIPVSSYKEGLQATADRLHIPCAYYERSSAMLGRDFTVNIFGNCDEVRILAPDGTETVQTGGDNITFTAEQYGFYRVTPYANGKAGLDCVCFAHTDWKTMFEKSVHSIEPTRDHIIGHTASGETVYMPPAATYRGEYDTNLCEHAMWAWSQLRYMQHYPVDQTRIDLLENFKNIMLADCESAYRERHTLIPHEQDVPHKMAPYNVYQSDRIQEAFNGVNVLLDLWRVEHNDNYLETAVAAMTSLLNETTKDGCIIRRGYEDYTTVTVMIFPVVDLYTALSSIGDPRAEQFKRYAVEIADFLVRRDLSFPTETSQDLRYGEFREDGSISCTALSVLYAAYFVENKPAYLDFARQVMKLHDSYCVQTCIPPMFHSSTRFWETIWEGDTDGPAICCGHAWSIWRGEAEYWLGLLDRNGDRLLSSYNTFMSNFSKQDADGNMYSIYQCEPYITGSAMTPQEIDRRYAVGFPRKKDVTLSRYAYARAYDTWFTTTAVIGDTVLNGTLKNGILHTDAPFFNRLYAENVDKVTVTATSEIEVFTNQPLTCAKGTVIRTTPFGFTVQPDADGIIELR